MLLNVKEESVAQLGFRSSKVHWRIETFGAVGWHAMACANASDEEIRRGIGQTLDRFPSIPFNSSQIRQYASLVLPGLHSQAFTSGLLPPDAGKSILIKAHAIYTVS